MILQVSLHLHGLYDNLGFVISIGMTKEHESRA